MTESTLLLRQVHPVFVQKGEVTSQAFRPTEEHDFKLSVYDGDLIQANAAWDHFTTVQKKQSAGILAVKVEECAALELPASSTPQIFLEHCEVDFGGLSLKKVEQKGKLLRDHAMRRGWQFQPA